MAPCRRAWRTCSATATPDNDADWATGLLHRYMEDYRLGREIAE